MIIVYQKAVIRTNRYAKIIIFFMHALILTIGEIIIFHNVK